jgi:hypothetical protein
MKSGFGRFAVACLVGILAAACTGTALAGALEAGLNSTFSVCRLGNGADLLAEEVAAAMEGSGVTVTSTGSSSLLTAGVGAYLAVPLAPSVALMTELAYAPRGAKMPLEAYAPSSGQSAAMDMKLKFNFLEVPVLLRFAPGAEGSMRPWLMAGPVLGLKLSSKVSVSADGVGESSEDLSYGVKSSYLGAVAGAGFEIPTARKQYMTFQIRYTRGFTNLVENEAYDLKVSDLSVMFGFGVRM